MAEGLIADVRGAVQAVIAGKDGVLATKLRRAEVVSALNAVVTSLNRDRLRLAAKKRANAEVARALVEVVASVGNPRARTRTDSAGANVIGADVIVVASGVVSALLLDAVVAEIEEE
jgi:threonine dehydrogenase-like Zn-dependent dehydrogenase